MMTWKWWYLVEGMSMVALGAIGVAILLGFAGFCFFVYRLHGYIQFEKALNEAMPTWKAPVR
jgi:hypothetical protein